MECSEDFAPSNNGIRVVIECTYKCLKRSYLRAICFCLYRVHSIFLVIPYLLLIPCKFIVSLLAQARLDRRLLSKRNNPWIYSYHFEARSLEKLRKIVPFASLHCLLVQWWSRVWAALFASEGLFFFQGAASLADPPRNNVFLTFVTRTFSVLINIKVISFEFHLGHGVVENRNGGGKFNSIAILMFAQ